MCEISSSLSPKKACNSGPAFFAPTSINETVFPHSRRVSSDRYAWAGDQQFQHNEGGREGQLTATAPVRQSFLKAADQNALNRRLQTFETVWSTLNANYFDQTFNGLDWGKVKTEYEPRVRAAKTDAELHALLNEMIGKLDRSHLAVISPEVYQAIERAKVLAKSYEAAIEKKVESNKYEDEKDTTDPGEPTDDGLTEYGIGVDLRILHDQFVVTRVDKDSTADRAGIKLGDVIESVNRVSLSELLKRIGTGKIDPVKTRKFLTTQIISGFINGEKDSLVEIRFLDAADQLKVVQIPRTRLPSVTISMGSSFPDRQLRYESYSLDDDIGYIRFNYFALPVVSEFCNSIFTFAKKKGLIVDLRGNLGGVLATLSGLGGMLNEKATNFGTAIYKSGTENLTVESKAKHFNGRIVFLVDNQTASAAEVFSASMRDNKRAIIVGDRTAGEALPAVTVALPTGAVLLYPFANYKTASGQFLEGVGVQPDVTAPLTRESLSTGRDAQIDAAIAAINNDKLFAFTDDPPPAKMSTPPGPPAKLAVPKVVNPPGQIYSAPPPPPPPVAASPVKDVIEPKASEIIAAFLAKISGKASVGDIQSYTASGTTELFTKGAKNQFTFRAFFEKPQKYTEILNSRASGEIREVHDGSKHLVQSDYGIEKEFPAFVDTGPVDLFAPIRTLTDADRFVSLRLLGEFERQGKMVKLIDAKTKDGYILSLAFEVDSGLLVAYVGSYYTIEFDDYRKVGEYLLPFSVDRQRVMKVVLETITLNKPIDPSNFGKKTYCYDVANKDE